VIIVGLLSTISSLGCGEALPVVARGRYVELATDHEDPVCAGSVAHLDRFIEGAFDALGETPPDRVFARVEWMADPYSRAFTRDEGDRIVARSARLFDEHELMHVAHLAAWPRSARFLHEGLAVMFEPHRKAAALLSGLSPAQLDEILGDQVLEGGRYSAAWFIVSQIVHDHGMEGLRELWHRVPARASTQQVREAYFELFERPIDALIEPWIYEGETGPVPVPRTSCGYTLCAGEAQPWDGDRWVGPAPAGCEDDPDAVGPDPTRRDAQQFMYGFPAGPVWREYVVDVAYPVEPPRLSETVTAIGIPCGFVCPEWFPVDFQPGGPNVLGVGPFRLQVRTELESLPTDTPGTIEFEYRQ
jgi:hypothetical protein